MQLSDDLFNGIRKTLGLSDDQTWDSRVGRRSGRLAATAEVSILPYGMAGTRARVVALVDISKSGVSIVDACTWAAGEKLIIHLPRTPEHVIPFVCEVRNSRISGAQFRIGAEFLDNQELHRGELLCSVGGVIEASVEAGAPMTEAGRRGPRQRFGKAGRAQLHTYQKDKPGPILEAEVADLSDVGAGLICARELAVGQTIVLRLCPPGGKTMTRMCVVANCRGLDNGKHRIGATFIHSPRPKGSVQVLLGWFRESQ